MGVPETFFSEKTANGPFAVSGIDTSTPSRARPPAAMVFARIALLLAGGAVVKLAFRLQDEDDAVRDAACGVVPRQRTPVDRRLGRTRSSVSSQGQDTETRSVGCNITETAMESVPREASTEPLLEPPTPSEARVASTPSALEANDALPTPKGVDDEEKQGDVVTPGTNAAKSVARGAADKSPKAPPTARTVHFATTPEPSPFAEAVGSAESGFSEEEEDETKDCLSDESSDDANDTSAEIGTLEEDVRKIAHEYLSTLPFVPPPGQEPPVTPGAGLKRPTVCASPFIAADGTRRMVRGEGGKGNLVTRNPRGGAAKRPLALIKVERDDNEGSFQTPGKTTKTTHAYPKTPGPVFEVDTEDDEDENENDENLLEEFVDENYGVVKLHASLDDLRLRASVDDSRERYAERGDDETLAETEKHVPFQLKRVDVNRSVNRY
jgi:hypothetical protein